MIDGLEQYRKRLLAESERLTQQIADIDSTSGLGSALSDSVGELSSYDNHPADVGSETFERSKDLALKDAASIQLGQVRTALERLDAGYFGRCAKCGGEIADERLQAVPHTILCIDCKASDEGWTDKFVRPIEEQALKYPFGRTFLDRNTDYNGYDGEDAWQEVARYGTSETPQDVPGAVRFEDMYRDATEHHGIVSIVDAIIDEPDNEDIPTDLSLDPNR